MPAFRARNPYYLRLSDRNVLPLYVYIDSRHLDWMTDYVLQKVLVDLRPMVLPKLKEETSGGGKKATVDVHRGDTYQFCYFIRKTEPHSVVVKARHFEAAPPAVRKPPPPLTQTKKRKGAVGSQKASKRRKTKGKGRAGESEEEEEAVFSDEDEDYEEEEQPRRSRRNEDIEMEEIKHEPDEPFLSGVGDAPSAPINVDIDEEEEKPKPILKLTYQDFSIYGHCLCIVVEPYPPLRAASRAPAAASASRPQSSAFFAPRGGSVAPSAVRAQTPLFLPDDEDERELSVAPFPPQQHVLPPVPLFHEEDDDPDNGGMMAFSQAMNGFTHLPAGAVDDDDDMDGAVFFGDADEVREL